MSKIVTFLDRNRSYSLTKNVLITDMKLSISTQTYSNIEFINNVQIIVLSGQVTNKLQEEENVLLQYETKEILNTCRVKWSGYAKYLTYSGFKCDKECSDIKCNKYVDYNDYIKNKQLKNIPEFRKLVIDDDFTDNV